MQYDSFMAAPTLKSNAGDRKVCKKRNLLWLFYADRKNPSSRSLFGITRHSLVMPNNDLRTDFSSRTSHSWNHHHHHIHFRALFSSTEGWAFWQVFLEGVLSTQNYFEGQQNPYLASFCHSQALHPMISLACQTFSVQPHSACVLLQSSLCCTVHVQTISSYWCGAPHLSPGCQALWEGSLS